MVMVTMHGDVGWMGNGWLLSILDGDPLQMHLQQVNGCLNDDG